MADSPQFPGTEAPPPNQRRVRLSDTVLVHRYIVPTPYSSNSSNSSVDPASTHAPANSAVTASSSAPRSSPPQDVVGACSTEEESHEQLTESQVEREPQDDSHTSYGKAAHTSYFLREEKMDARKKKKKVLLMGKSGSGKSSMRSIIFSNWVAKDVRRLGATIDVDHTHAKFMGSLTLNLWDCGGQDAFMESYLTNQRKNIFSDVAVMIYVFDIESREFDRDLEVYSNIILALKEFSPEAFVFCLIHKMDLIQPEHQDRLAEERSTCIRDRSHSLKIDTFASSIWNQSLYRAWASIVHKLIPNLTAIEHFLSDFADQISAEEIILFERSTFLTVTSVVTPRGRDNPVHDRHERISNIFKTFKHSIAKNTKSTPASAGFVLWKLQTRQFNIFLQNFTDNTYIFVVLPPGEAAFNCAVYNTASARDLLRRHVDLAEKGVEAGGGLK